MYVDTNIFSLARAFINPFNLGLITDAIFFTSKDTLRMFLSISKLRLNNCQRNHRKHFFFL